MKKVALVILDGWGHGDKTKSDGIFNADTPFMDQLEKNEPNAELLTDGEHVGLPKGQMGNSEVGHLNIGAGRIVYQELTRINKSIKDGDFFQIPVLTQAMKTAKERNCKLHFIGLVSDGGVHSSIDHLKALCQMAKELGVPKSYIHAFTDGRDCNPNSAVEQISELDNFLKNTNTRIASLIGRYYAMDRDNRWERIKKAYDLLVHGRGASYPDATTAIRDSYEAGVTDEFIEAVVIRKEAEPLVKIEDGDVVICFNFRTDRCREISTVLSQKNMPEYEMRKLQLSYATMTNYDKTFQDVQVVFEKENLVNTLGEVVSAAGLTQVRIAETEKYPHVTYFFSGGREQPFENESRIMIESPKVATYDLQPEMSAPKIREAICKKMEESQPDFICLNFANTDMVGHTGNYEAILIAAKHVDDCLRQVVEKGLEQNYSFIIIADHGNSDYAINEDGSPNTAHSLNPVPVVVIDKDTERLRNGSLRDVAPTILDLMKIDLPEEMTGQSLISR